jgi:hypothetical protein
LSPEATPTARFRARAHRLIASRWPPVGVFDRVASAGDLEGALLLEALTNDRINETLARLNRLDRSEWVTGQPGATFIMAALCHPAPGGGRFNGETLGAGYCACEVETAIAETVYHHTHSPRLESGRATLSSGIRSALMPIAISVNAAPSISAAPRR